MKPFLKGAAGRCRTAEQVRGDTPLRAQVRASDYEPYCDNHTKEERTTSGQSGSFPLVFRWSSIEKDSTCSMRSRLFRPSASARL
jgi:hypothetical protein